MIWLPSFSFLSIIALIGFYRPCAHSWHEIRFDSIIIVKLLSRRFDRRRPDVFVLVRQLFFVLDSLRTVYVQNNRRFHGCGLFCVVGFIFVLLSTVLVRIMRAVLLELLEFWLRVQPITANGVCCVLCVWTVVFELTVTLARAATSLAQFSGSVLVLVIFPQLFVDLAILICYFDLCIHWFHNLFYVFSLNL